MQYQSIQKQQEALQRLKHFLEGFQEELIGTMDRYKKRVEDLHVDGLSEEVYRKYSGDNYSRDKDYIHSLITHIQNTDIPYINKNLGATEENKIAASGASYGGLDF